MTSLGSRRYRSQHATWLVVVGAVRSAAWPGGLLPRSTSPPRGPPACALATRPTEHRQAGILIRA
jgi:hypothetical protein